jgi:hypothetical protein
LFGLPSQSDQPAEQTGLQAPAEHEVEPCALLQVVPHAPQLVTLVFRFVSQPFAGLPSQLPQPLRQTGAQLPATQPVMPFGFEHCWPQPPQLFTLVVMFVSQPLPALPSQLAKPGAQPS